MGEKIYIVGAHSRAQTVAEYIRSLYPGTEVEAYLYDNDEPNPEKIGEVPVVQMNETVKLNPDYPVCIGTRGVHHEKLMDRLKSAGFQRICPVTPELDSRLRNAYVRKYYADNGKNFLKLDELEATNRRNRKNTEKMVYVVRSVLDKTLQSEYRLASYEKEIQAGAALADRCLYPGIDRDDTGDHISVWNRQYCELTVLYWLWKHAKEETVGMVHYRRHFILPEDWFMRMQENGVDVILPVPLYVAPNLADNFKKRHDPEVWAVMMNCLKTCSPDEYRDAEIFFQKNLYSPCNMFIMRKEILDALCSWLFPVLFRVTERIGQKADEYQNRYPGFLSERLISFFFEKNRKKYKVAYADKNFLP